MLTLFTLLLTTLSQAFAMEANINIHQSSLQISLPQQLSGSPCLELNLASNELLQELEILAGPGLNPSQENELGYIYRLIPENKQTLRFRGLQLHERSNTVEIRSKKGESLAELMQKHLNSSEAVLIRFSNQCQ